MGNFKILAISILVLFTLIRVSHSHTNEVCDPVNQIDPAKFQLETFKQCVKGPTGYATTSSGQPVDITDTNSLNTNLLFNNYFLDAISHSISERPPERVVHAKGTGAHGYFEVTHDISHICSADVFNGIGKRTPISKRFSLSATNIGGSDTRRDTRGCSVKFFTKEGNLDLLSLHTPVYFYRDPLIFPDLLRARKPNPATNIFDYSLYWDAFLLRPITTHLNLWRLSDYGIPNTYRHMSCFPLHTYEVVNKKGESSFIKFNFTTNEGLENLSAEEATRIATADKDYFVRDLYNAIANKNYPSWTLYIDVLNKKDLKDMDFDPFDTTRLWPKGSYKQYTVGQLVLDRNPLNMAAEIQQLAMNPGNLVPGIVGSPDKLFEGRIIIYNSAANYRLSFNHNNIYSNQPLYAKTYNRDGSPPLNDNMMDAPNYYPNSFNGPIPVVDTTRPKDRTVILESSAVDLGPAAEFWTETLNDDQRTRLISNAVFELSQTTKSIQKRAVELFSDVHPELGSRLERGLRNANATAPMPTNIIY